MTYDKRFRSIPDLPIIDQGEHKELLHNVNMPCNKQECLCPLEKFKETPKPVLKEQLYKLEDGNQVPVEICALPVVNSQGQLTKAVEIIMDITERKQAEEKIVAAHRQMMDIIEFLPDATLAVNREKKVIVWNRAMEEITGLSKIDIIGQGNYAYSVPFYGDRKPVLLDLLWTEREQTDRHYGCSGSS